MKKKDAFIIIGIAIVSAIFSYVLSNYVFGGEKNYTLTAPQVKEISAEFPELSKTYFNKNSLNPTKDITIGGSTNEKPFQELNTDGNNNTPF